jgi:hypothetical protein
MLPPKSLPRRNTVVRELSFRELRFVKFLETANDALASIAQPCPDVKVDL